MKRVAISELKARLSEYLDAVKAGEEIVVTDRGKPVARLIRASDHGQIEARVEELVRAGRLRPPRAGALIDPDALLRVRPTVPGAGVVEALLEEREHSR
jgi:prevent-host-death family protein